jgi:hypothetical protein
MCHTHLKETMERIEQNAQRVNEAAAQEGGKSLPARAAGILVRKPSATKTPAEETREIAQGCILCERLDSTMERYALTLLYMWKHEADFQKAFAESKGFCLNHYAQLLSLAPEEVSGKDLQTFVETLTKLERENLGRIEKELEWFTLKFDYRNQDKPWGKSRDAVERTVGKLRGLM